MVVVARSLPRIPNRRRLEVEALISEERALFAVRRVAQ
jgi:hypothetical protein